MVEVYQSHYKHTSDLVLENKEMKLYWDQPIIKERTNH
jgi:hypothetical protein